jgi:hypothetical protein
MIPTPSLNRTVPVPEYEAVYIYILQLSAMEPFHLEHQAYNFVIMV